MGKLISLRSRSWRSPWHDSAPRGLHQVPPPLGRERIGLLLAALELRAAALAVAESLAVLPCWVVAALYIFRSARRAGAVLSSV
jgi:hypothetical protein